MDVDHLSQSSDGSDSTSNLRSNRLPKFVQVLTSSMAALLVTRVFKDLSVIGRKFPRKYLLWGAGQGAEGCPL